MDREKFHTWLIEFLKEVDPEIVKDIPPESVMICGRVETFNEKEDRELFLLPANQSAVRDVNCSNCNYQVVMSNKAFADYEKHGRKNQILCTVCFFEKLNSGELE